MDHLEKKKAKRCLTISYWSFYRKQQGGIDDEE